MTPAEHVLHSRYAFTRTGGPLDHQHGQAQQACRMKLGRRSLATGILGDDDFRAVSLQKRPLLPGIEGPAPDDDSAIPEGRRCCGRIDQTEQVAMLRNSREGVQMLTPDGEKHPPRRPGQCSRRSCHIGQRHPAIPGSRSPGGALQPEERCAGPVTGSARIAADPRGERMRGVHDPADPLLQEILRQPLGPAEAADPYGNRLRTGGEGAPGIGQDRREPRIGHRGGKTAGLRRAAKDQGRTHE